MRKKITQENPLRFLLRFLLRLFYKFSDELQKKAKRYQELYGRTDLSDDERAERADLRMELKDAEDVLSKIEGKKVL